MERVRSCASGKTARQMHVIPSPVKVLALPALDLPERRSR